MQVERFKNPISGAWFYSLDGNHISENEALNHFLNHTAAISAMAHASLKSLASAVRGIRLEDYDELKPDMGQADLI